ncbi:lysis system o-spanin lipoprotein Rz1, partial [Vibrio anguillarum]
KPVVLNQCPTPLPPEAWAMQEPHNLTKQLEKIIYTSEE